MRAVMRREDRDKLNIIFLNFILLILLMLAFSSCRNSVPPQIPICIHDGIGADCDIPGVGKVYKTPSELKNYWMTDQESMAKFSSWCYALSYKDMMKLLDEKKRDIQSPWVDIEDEDDVAKVESEPTTP